MARKKIKSQEDSGQAGMTASEVLKQGEVENITETVQEFKGAPVVQKSLITMRNGKPTRVFFDEKGKESGSEVIGTK